MSEPAWHPDPTGRNQYRWWDGAAWADSVSNNGVVGIDPVQATARQVPDLPQAASSAGATVFEPAAPQVPGGGAPQSGQPQAGQPQFGTPASSPQFGTPQFGASASSGAPQFGATDFAAASISVAEPKRSNPLKWIIPIIVVLAVGAVLFFVLGGDDDGGGGTSFGVVEGELEEDDSVVFFDYELDAGDAVRMRVEPSSRLDAVLLVLIDEDLGSAFGDFVVDTFSDDGFTDPDDFFSDAEDLFSDSDFGDRRGLVVIDSVDDGFEGEPDANFFTALVSGTYTIAVSSFDAGSSGSFRLIVEKFDETLDIDGLETIDDIDDFFSDNDDFFSDEDFFSNEDEFDTGS